MLKIENLTIRSDTRTVVKDVSVAVKEGEIAAVLGPNGAGKSELVLGVAGMMSITSGAVHVDGQSLAGQSPQLIRAVGVAAVPEGHQVLEGLSVLDNLRAAGSFLDRARRDSEVDAVLNLFPELAPLQEQLAGSLSGGQQQMVAIAQALVCRPRFLLIDEMSLGLAPVVIDRLIGVIRDLRARGMGILLIEQFTQLALDVADHCYVLSQGSLKFSGAPQQLKADRSILENAYLSG